MSLQITFVLSVLFTQFSFSKQSHATHTEFQIGIGHLPIIILNGRKKYPKAAKRADKIKSSGQKGRWFSDVASGVASFFADEILTHSLNVIAFDTFPKDNWLANKKSCLKSWSPDRFC